MYIPKNFYTEVDNDGTQESESAEAIQENGK